MHLWHAFLQGQESEEKEMKTTLVIMAAGIGSRFGGGIIPEYKEITAFNPAIKNSSTANAAAGVCARYCNPSSAVTVPELPTGSGWMNKAV